ncbi:transposase [Photobacterium damselae]|uniref:transposase n=1 Tax=Photobacterium damselae TaxID=38293 RepID=UPI001E460755|nr:transposase [Photobacterium damselae]
MLAHTFGCVRFVYNSALSFSKERYEQGNKTNFNDWSKNLTTLEKEADFSWLKNVSSGPLQQSFRHLDKVFFKSEFGYPKFKNKRGKQPACYMANAFKFNAEIKQITLAKLKNPCKVTLSIPFNSSPSSVYVSKTKTGKDFISMLVETEIQPLPIANKTVGVDVGIKSLAACSDGAIFNNPKYTKKYEKKLAKAQRKLSKKAKGSNNFNKQRIIVAKIHEKIANCRVDFTRKMTTKLINENQVIYTESLRVKNMVKNKKLAKEISDANFGEIVRQLEYQAAWYG